MVKVESVLVDMKQDNLEDIEEEIRIVIRRLLSFKYGFKPNVVVHVYRG